jgi:hypothetical protein
MRKSIVEYIGAASEFTGILYFYWQWRVYKPLFVFIQSLTLRRSCHPSPRLLDTMSVDHTSLVRLFN